jgi:hypothetical protein
MKIYDHIQCIGIIQNSIFFIIIQGKTLCRREPYNDSPIVITIQYISQKYSKFFVRRNESKLTECIAM